MSIRNKVMLAILLAVVLSIAGVSVMVSREMKKAFVNNFRVSSEAQLEHLESFINVFFESAVGNVNLLATSPLVRQNITSLTAYTHIKEQHKPIGAELKGDEHLVFRELERITKVFPAYALVYVGAENGGFVQAPDDPLSAGFNPAARPWFMDTVRAGRPLITEAYISDTGEAVCTVAAPVTAMDGKVRGVAAFDISLETLTRKTGSVKVGETGYVLMLDAAGQVISDPRYSSSSTPEADRWLGKTVDQLPSDAAAGLKHLQAIRHGVTEIRFDGKDWLAGVQETENNWVLIMLQEKDEVFADAMNVTMAIILVGLVIVLIMAVVAWFLARSISRPVSVLAGAARQVAGGDLKAIPEDGGLFKGELGVLHRALRQMVSKLAELIETANVKISEAEEALGVSKQALKNAEEARAQADQARREGVVHTVSQVSNVLDQLTHATGRLADEIAGMEKQAENQQDIVSGTAAAVQQMNIAVSEVAHSSSRTAQLADEARNEAHTGKALVMDVVSNMNRIEDQSRSMRESISALGDQVTDIGKIMGVINDIADQTNLLALNAAIEAARAGDAGRGFAVVADEVRKLAEKTMEATRQVGSAIASIQEVTRRNMHAMQEAADFISSSTGVASKAGTALSSIEEVVDKTAGEVRAIATASEEQSATTEEINRSTERVRQLSDEVARSSQRSNEVVAELVRLSRQLTKVVENLQKE